MMRTNIVIDDKLMAATLKATGTRTKREAVEQGDRARLLRTLDDAPHARRAHPTAEHFWPLLVAAGAADPAQPVQVIEGGITHGVLAMDSYAFGVAAAAA